MTGPRCRICRAALSHTFVDLGLSPLANSHVTSDRLNDPEVFFPLHVRVCDECFLVQIEEFESPERLFSEYAYFSSYSQTWLSHAEAYAAKVTTRFGLGRSSKVVEVASNDGYLLQYFAARGIPILGIEPAGNVAEVALAREIPTEVMFFGRGTAQKLKAEGHAADLMTANNVLAHVPDIIDFVGGFSILLKPEGVATFEFPHLLRLIADRQFDTIYHEHFSYLSLGVVGEVMSRNGLRIFDVEVLPTHGGSLRVFVCHRDGGHPEQPEVEALLEEERQAGLFDVEGYSGFAAKVAAIKCETLDFLIRARREGKRVCGYGAAAKGNTFINYCGFGPELLALVADKSPHKQGTWLPGSRIPVVAPETMLTLRPDYVLILPWNIKDEVAAELAAVREWNGRFVTAIPELAEF